MLLIVGGAYQGKLDCALQRNPGGRVFRCDAENPDFDMSADIISGLHLTVLAQMRAGTDALEYLRERLPALQGKIVTCGDISCGVVPADPEARLWRETTGRCLTLLSENADEVVRVFCGIGSRIK